MIERLYKKGLNNNKTDNPGLKRIRLYFFFIFGASGFLVPFIGLFFREKGLTGTQIGLIGTGQSFIYILAAPFWGRVGDHYIPPVRLLRILLLLTGAMALWLGQLTSFIFLFLITMLHSFVESGISPLSDTLALRISSRKKISRYGSVRVWGSAGWAIVTLLAGRAIEETGLSLIFIGYSAGMLLSILILTTLRRIPAATSSQSVTIDRNNPLGLTARVRSLWMEIRKHPVLMPLGTALALGALFGAPVHRFEMIYLDELGASTTLIGLAGTIPALVEFIGIPLADRSCRKWNPLRIFLWSMIIEAMRMVIIFFMPSVWTILAMKITEGIQYSFNGVALINMIDKDVPEKRKNTIIALFTITIINAAGIIGNPLGGAVFDLLGTRSLYGLAAGGYITAILVLNRTLTSSRYRTFQILDEISRQR